MTGHWNRRIALGALAALGATAAVAQGAKTVKPDPKLAAQLAPSGRLRAAINAGNVVLAQKGGPQGATGPSVDIANEVGRRLGGGSLPETTHSSSATSRARTAGMGLCGLRGLTLGPRSLVPPARPPCWVPAIM